nr:hypothetical protein [Tanacetum cinerariifolium]
MIFAFPRKLWSFVRVPSYFDYRDTTLFQLFNFSVHDLYWFFNKVKNVEGTVDITEFFKKLKSLCHWADPIKDLKWSNVPVVKLSLLFEPDDTFPSLQTFLDLYYLFGGFMDYLWSLFILSVSLARMKCADLVRRSTMTQIVSCPLDVLGSFVMKSIVIFSHFHVGIFGCTKPGWMEYFDLWNSCMIKSLKPPKSGTQLRVMDNALTQSGLIRSFRVKASAIAFAFSGCEHSTLCAIQIVSLNFKSEHYCSQFKVVCGLFSGDLHVFVVVRVDENIIDEHYHKFIKVWIAHTVYEIHEHIRVLSPLVTLLALKKFGILLGEPKESMDMRLSRVLLRSPRMIKVSPSIEMWTTFWSQIILA